MSDVLDHAFNMIGSLELLDPFRNLADQIENDFTKFDFIVSDEASGRIPTLFFARYINNRRKNVGLKPIPVYFIVAGQVENFHRISKKIKKFLKKKGLKKGKTVLLVTEYVSSGFSIARLKEVFDKLKITAHIASVRISKQVSDYVRYRNMVINYYAEIKYSTPPKMYRHSELSGVYKDEHQSDIHPKKYEGDYQDSRLDHKPIRYARQDIYFIADHLFSKYLQIKTPQKAGSCFFLSFTFQINLFFFARILLC